MKACYRCALALGMALSGLTTNAASDAEENEERVLFDFSSPASSPGWFVVNDDVMGGRSEGGFTFKDEVLVFSGKTNTDGGGFSSIRAPLPAHTTLANAGGIRIKVRASGQRTFKVDLRQVEPERRRLLAYRADIPMRADGEWEEARIPFSAFIPTWRGERIPGAELDPASVTHLGIFIYDGRDGPFRLEVQRVETYIDE